MTKVGIISLPLTYNIGGILQSYSLVEICKRKGCLPFVLTRRRTRKSIALELLVSLKWKGIIFVSMIAKRFNISFLSTYPLVATQFFKTKHIPNSDKLFFGDVRLSQWATANHIDLFICGSDQIWNPTSFPSLNFAFAQLDVPRTTRRVAFAPSLGHDSNRFTSTQSQQIASFLQSFAKLSCREQSGAELISRLADRAVSLMPDPTFVINRETYAALAGNASFPYPRSYLFAYILDPTVATCEFISSFAKKHNLRALSFFPMNYKSILNRQYQMLKHFGIDVIDSPTPENWLKGVMDADLVITDSFHGSVFSLIFNTPFYSLINAGRGGTRFLQLKSTFGIDNTFLELHRVHSHQLMVPTIDWPKVNRKISELSLLAHDFLDDCIPK
ncbi:polysaccharide pyruvyl transferase family protein [Synechococcus sp. CCY9202]|uniref:polysaccharide pyruvyl transferase family protein n=1 Tax=Synechococcus sp. CCY9202 TaxID=174698 RepID=UPI002B1F1B4D|nr:polysaccharide pyruvyl transferase family protein [Synechococcus sp. CCY9202]MEA5423639.1 polysaccharide pyruvyl transferase family protein [Synechococcus sp. CCY9202]